MNVSKINILILLCFLAATVIAGCESQEKNTKATAAKSEKKADKNSAPSTGRSHETVKNVRPYMGTLVEITVIGRDRERLLRATNKAFAEFQRIEELMSPYKEGSDISRLNRKAGEGKIKVSPEVLDILVRSKELSRNSQGAFDLTAASLGPIWSFDKDSPRVPSRSDISKALQAAGPDKLEIYEKKGTAGLSGQKTRIHPGGIAKGHACDRAAAVLKEEGVSMAMVNAGGDIRVLGRKINRPWKVGVQDPRDRNRIMAWIPIANEAVATSGDYEKFFIKDGKRYCHILDPRNGRPADKSRSATVIADKAWLADGLATAVFVLGPEEGLELSRSMDAEALVIDSGGEIHMTEGLQDRVHWIP